VKGCVIAIALLIGAGCDHVRQTVVGPAGEASTAPAGFFALSGRITDLDGAAVAGARVQMTTDSSIQATLTGMSGEYRFENVRGNVGLVVSKDGFSDTSSSVFVASDRVLNLSLWLRGPLTLVPGKTLRGIVEGGPCDSNWDARAPCAPIEFVPPVTGVYEVVLTWRDSSEVDLLVDGSLSLYWSDRSGRIRALIPGDAGVRRVIRIQSYYSPAPFELSASLISTP